MKIWLVLAAIVAVFGVFCLLPLNVRICLAQKGLKVRGNVGFRILGVPFYTLRFSSPKEGSRRDSRKAKGDKAPKRKRQLPPPGRRLELLRVFLEINSWLIGHIKCQRFFWKTRLSLGDAAATGIGGGLLWSFKGYLFSLLKRKMAAEECHTEILVTPVFNGETTATDFDCIFRLQTGYIIIAGLRLILMVLMFNLVLKGAKTA